MLELEFSELSEHEVLEVNGGLLPAIAGAAVSYFGYGLADRVVEKYTGDKIDEHVSDAIGYGIEKLGEGLKFVGGLLGNK